MRFYLTLFCILFACASPTVAVAQESAANHPEDNITLTPEEQEALAQQFALAEQNVQEKTQEAGYWQHRYNELRTCVLKQKETDNAAAICLGAI